MNNKQGKNCNKKKLAISFYILLILFAIVTTASYTWFSISRTPRVSDMNLYVSSSARLELSADPLAEEWTLHLALQDMMPASTPLRPVTWIDEEQSFYAAAYGVDGRLLPLSFWERLNDSRNANKEKIDGYYIKLSFFARATGNVTVRLSPAVEVDQGIHGSGTFLIGTPLWNAESVSHDNMGMGAEMAMRMGIRITPVNASGETTGEKSKFFIYEPNADVHADGTEGYVPTHSVTGRENLISDKFLIRQTVSTWTETDPAQRDVVVKNLGNFMDDTTLFLLDSGEMVRLDVYIWLEGQDQDCMQTIHEAQVMACLQFDADPDNQSGLQPIE